jgi:hypothetical protein
MDGMPADQLVLQNSYFRRISNRYQHCDVFRIRYAASGTTAIAPYREATSMLCRSFILGVGSVFLQAAGIVTAKVAALTDGVVKAMFMTKIKSVLVVGLALGGIGLAIGLSTNPVAVAQAETPKEAPVKKESPASPVATKKDEKPPHIVEKTDMKGRMESPWLPFKVHDGKPTEDGLVIASKSFFAKMQTYPDIRFREFFDPRYLKKHGLTERDIAFEVTDKWPVNQGIHNIVAADDNQTALCILNIQGGKELFILRWVVYEGHLYISPEKAPDPKTGIFKPWILRTKVN